MVTILVVGNAAIRNVVRAVLEADARLHVIDEADDGGQALESYRRRPARVVVICRETPEDDRRFDTVRRLRAEAPDSRIVVLA